MLPRYHKIILILYAAIMPAVFYFGPVELGKYFKLGDISKGIFIALGFFLLYYLFNLLFKWRDFKVVELTLRQKLFVVLYAFAFAIPEEVIFRGIIQTLIHNLYGAVVAIILGSLVFGMVHLSNRAKGARVSEWNWSFAALAFYGGLLFGLIFWLTESLVLPILLHALTLIVLKFYSRKN